MGANARRRREEKAAARAAEFQKFVDSIDPHDFVRMSRTHCSECGSADITWSTLGAVAVGPEPYRSHAREVLPMLGASADAWTCGDCDGFGAFEQGLQSGMF